MSREQPWPSTHLFTVRLWTEVFNGESGDLCGKVQHVLSGETRYFRQMSALHDYLAAKVQQLERENEEGGKMER